MSWKLPIISMKANILAQQFAFRRCRDTPE